MSSLAKDAASFKSTLQRQDTTSWHSKTHPDAPPNESSPSAEPSNPSAKKKRPKSSKQHLFGFMAHALRLQLEDIVYSQPADTGTGIHVNTQLVYAVEHLKV